MTLVMGLVSEVVTLGAATTKNCFHGKNLSFGPLYNTFKLDPIFLKYASLNLKSGFENLLKSANNRKSIFMKYRLRKFGFYSFCCRLFLFHSCLLVLKRKWIVQKSKRFYFLSKDLGLLCIFYDRYI